MQTAEQDAVDLPAQIQRPLELSKIDEDVACLLLVRAEREAAQATIRQDIDQRQNTWLALSERFFNFACYARLWFAEGDLQQKREILATLGSNLVLKDKKLSIDAPKPFLILKDSLSTIPEAKGGFEPKVIGMNKGERELVGAMSPRWRGVVDWVRTYFGDKIGCVA